ncbi:hypothetical protein [Leucobacter sp. wl10]|uniref:DUF7882 family protein n=1 Tax=Leucobacter sp. wl10 TaxID=2304677 RepID=UPI000E5A8C65|nr:hypothetical protein [Leucobacter sp. wl10]RGE23727.1 hypothetical protein D1J51_01820 [Leucobacter sp. wl10]
MGTLIYGKTRGFEFEDRTLEHVRFVVSAKLRRKESFFLTWAPSGPGATGSVSLWISPDIPISFRLPETGRAPLSKEWIEAMLKMSHTNRGLVVIPERAAGGGGVR